MALYDLKFNPTDILHITSRDRSGIAKFINRVLTTGEIEPGKSIGRTRELSMQAVRYMIRSALKDRFQT